ncbi:MAG: SAM-dependent chlorinase/fluorinase [Bacteroidota bacterium]
MKQPSIITLTTDYGLSDYYVATLKGTLLSATPPASIVDITHLIPPHNIVQAAYMLKNTYKSFPKKSLHIVDVNIDRQERSSLLLVNHQEHYFLLPDNGIVSLLFDVLPTDIFRLTKANNDYSSFLKLCAKVTELLPSPEDLITVGKPTRDARTRISLQPVINPNQIRAAVIHIDHYENVIINVHKMLFEEVGGGRDFQLFFRRHDPICRLSKNYTDVEVGETLCRFNSSGYLELAVCMGKAASLLGLQIDDMIQIDFQY